MFFSWTFDLLFALLILNRPKSTYPPILKRPKSTYSLILKRPKSIMEIEVFLFFKSLRYKLSFYVYIIIIHFLSQENIQN